MLGNHTVFGLLAGSLLAPAGLGAAEIILSIERTTMPVDEWADLREGFSQYEALLASYGGGDGYSVRVDDDSIDFIYAFNSGWDYEFYSVWNNGLIDQINEAYVQSGTGFQWAIEAIGEIDSELNPWNEVDWLTEVEVVNGSYLKTGSIGWLYAEDWSPEGQFWAYSWEEAFNGWLYVLGDGYYYNWQSAEWLLNLAGTGWFYVFESDGAGGTTGNGNWAALVTQPMPVIAELDAIIQSEMILQNIPGMTVGVFDNGQIVHARAYGYKNIETGEKMELSDVIRWASISKPLTAVAAFQAMEEVPDFDLYDPVSEWFGYWTDSETVIEGDEDADPPIPDRDFDETEILITHLLTNRSGINHYGDGRGDEAEGIFTYDASAYKPSVDGYNARAAVDVFKDSGLDFQPGSNYLYSTFGFNLLGSVVDAVVQGGYVQHVQQHIAGPLGMNSLRVANGEMPGYQKSKDGRLVERVAGSRQWRLPGGGWESNVIDLTRFGMGLVDRSLLKNSGSLWRSIPNPDNPAVTLRNNDYRYGIEANRPPGNVDLLVSHGGAHENLRTLLAAYPYRDLGVAIMIPSQYADPWRFAGRILNHFGRNFGENLTPLDRCENDEATSDRQFLGVWRKTGEDVIIRRGYSHDAFLREYQTLRDNGYYCADFEALEEDGELRWDGIFKKGPGGAAIWRNFDFDSFNAKWNEMIGLGFRLIDLETYVVDGQRRWAGLFRPGTGRHALWRGLDTEEFATKREEMAASGRKLVDIEVTNTSDGLRWSGVWAEGEDGLLNRNYERAEFLTLALSRASDGWVLRDVETYFVGGTQYFAGIWERSEFTSGFFDGDWCTVMKNHDELSADGFELIDLERW